MSAKLTEDAKRGDLWLINPYDCVVVGRDKGHPPDMENDCYDEARLRKLDDEAKIEALADSIEAMGENVEPAVLKKKKAKDGSEYLAVNAGRRRTFACRRVYDRLKAKGIDFKMRVVLADKHEEAAVTFMRARAENGNREDNTPTENARDFAQMVRFAGDTLDRVSKETKAKAKAIFGVDDSTLTNWLTLLRATPKVQAMVDSRALPQNVIREIIDLPPEEQEAKAVELATKAQEEGKGANILAIARFQKQQRKAGTSGGTKGAPESEGLTRGQIVGVLRLIEEDEAAGKEPKMSAEHIEALEAVTGARKADRIKGLQGYLNRLEEKKKERAEKKADRATKSAAE